MPAAVKRAPKLYHVGRRKGNGTYLYLEKGIFIWANLNLKPREMKYLYALMQCAGDGSFSPSTEYIKSLTGLDKSAQSKARSILKDYGILEHEEKKYIKIRYDKLYELSKEYDDEVQ